jgi:hypothetical protein
MYLWILIGGLCLLQFFYLKSTIEPDELTTLQVQKKKQLLKHIKHYELDQCTKLFKHVKENESMT